MIFSRTKSLILPGADQFIHTKTAYPHHTQIPLKTCYAFHKINLFFAGIKQIMRPATGNGQSAIALNLFITLLRSFITDRPDSFQNIFIDLVSKQEYRLV